VQPQVHPTPGQLSPQLQIDVSLVESAHPHFLIVSILNVLMMINLMLQSYPGYRGLLLYFDGRDLYNFRKTIQSRKNYLYSSDGALCKKYGVRPLHHDGSTAVISAGNSI
jgi:hypothetical protein